jgi:hypothetical protein
LLAKHVQLRELALARRAQCTIGMAAIFALVFVPALAAVLFMVGLARDGMSWSAGIATVIFVALAAGTFTGLFRLARVWEDEELS